MATVDIGLEYPEQYEVFKSNRAEVARMLGISEDQIELIKDGVYREVQGTGMTDVITHVTDGELNGDLNPVLSDMEMSYEHATFGVGVRSDRREIQSVKMNIDCPPIRIFSALARSDVRL